MTTHTSGCSRKGRGRPKMFDRENMLDTAMELFWQHGYEATSLSSLVEATGATAPTLYAEFTNKEGLFRAVLDRYVVRFVEKHKAELLCDEKTVEQALLGYLTAVAQGFACKDTPAGCFFINTSATLAAASESIACSVRERHARQEQALMDFLRKRQQRGQIPEKAALPLLAQFLSCVIYGMSVSAREGADEEKLMQIIHTTLRLWPMLVSDKPVNTPGL